MRDLTPELSRPVAGRRTRASVAQKHVADATTWGRLERIVRRQPGLAEPMATRMTATAEPRPMNKDKAETMYARILRVDP